MTPDRRKAADERRVVLEAAGDPPGRTGDRWAFAGRERGGSDFKGRFASIERNAKVNFDAE